ncbi:MAG: 4Fe-4S dicluster domain-containing protein [Longimicrobiales bacterium]
MTTATPDARVDERDTMFARMARKEGTPAYEEYYTRRPELKETDDRLRRMPELCRPGGLRYDSEISGQAEAYFEAIEGIEPDETTVECWADVLRTSTDPSPVLRAMARELGAVEAGTTAVDPAYVYSHKGRHDEDYGRPLEPEHGWALIFLVEMDHGAMRQAPDAPVLRESARQYYRAAAISMTMAAALERAGYPARSQHDAHYDVILPPLAVDAGLGEVGRNNILVADRYGSRVRIGAVTTELPLKQAEPIDLGVERFCALCRKCAENCPSRSLRTDGKEEVRGIRKWTTRAETCYAYWRRTGTDCGICMAGCPFSHPDNAFHNAVRRSLARMPWLAGFALWWDNLLYGRDWKRV